MSDKNKCSPSRAMIGGFQLIPASKDVYEKFVSDYWGSNVQKTPVWYNGHKCRVKSFDPNRDIATVEFDDKNLIPPTMEVPTKSLHGEYGNSVVNPHVMCPWCRVAWKETVLFRFTSYDCPQCGAKKEDYV